MEESRKKHSDTAALSVVQREVIECMQEAPRLVAGVKREAQRVIGHFIETLRNRMDKAEDDKKTELESMKPPQVMSEKRRLQARKNAVSDLERTILLSFCGQVKPKDAYDHNDEVGGDKEENDHDIENRQDMECRVMISFMTYLYSGNYPRENSKAGSIANHLINWLIKSGIHHPARTRSELQQTMAFTPTFLVRSVAAQLATELKRMYGHGARDLHNKVCYRWLTQLSRTLSSLENTANTL
jgi:hypothetical protein